MPVNWVQDGDQKGSATATQLAATETLESITAKSERTLGAVRVKDVTEKQCQTTLHESELTEVSAMLCVPMTHSLQHVICTMALLCQPACNKNVSPDIMTVVESCKHVMQAQQSVVGTAHRSQQVSPTACDAPCVTQQKKNDSPRPHCHSSSPVSHRVHRKQWERPIESDWTIPAKVAGLRLGCPG